jgi:purine-binding chemotaxis protein CheW
MSSELLLPQTTDVTVSMSPSEAEQRRASKHAAFMAFASALLRASQGEADAAATGTRQFATFFVRDFEVGVPIVQCREVIRVSNLTRIPEAPAPLRGVVAVRGRIVPVVDMRQCLGLGALQPTPKARLVLVEAHGRTFALLVDRASQILRLSGDAIGPPDPQALPAAAQLLIGTARTDASVLHLIDVERLLCSPLLSGPSASEEDDRA